MSAEQTDTIKVGQVVEFTGYTALQEGVAPLLKDGERVMIMKMGVDDDQNATFEVRPVNDKGNVVTSRDGDALYSDEFKVLDVQPEPAKAKPKATTKRQKARNAAKAEANTKTGKKPAKKAVAKKAPAKKAAKKSTAKAAKKPAKKSAKTSAKGTGKKAAAKPKTATKSKAKASKKPAKQTTQASGDADTGSDFKHDPAVLALIRKSNDIIEVARTLSGQHEEIYFKLGGVLYQIKDQGMHVTAGYEDSVDGFDAYVEDHVGGVGKRKSYYLVKTYRHFRRAGITSKDMAAFGWTKARELTKIKPEDLNDEWLEKARTMTREELKAEISSTYVGASTEGRETIKKTTYKYVLLGDANTLVEQAMDHAKKQVDDGDANKAFEHVCTEYLNYCVDVEGAATMVPKTAEDLEQAAERLGLDITINGPVE
jgi:hypothetical protein